MHDVRMKDFKDYSNHSKYADTYMENKEFFNEAKPFIHLKLDQVCRKTTPTEAGCDYWIEFNSSDIVIRIEMLSENKGAISIMEDWKNRLTNSINSLAIKEFRSSQAWPEDKKVSDMLKNLADNLSLQGVNKLKNQYFIQAASTF